MVTCRPPCAYKCLCIKMSIVGTLFPLASNDSCMDSVETPKTFALEMNTMSIQHYYLECHKAVKLKHGNKYARLQACNKLEYFITKEPRESSAYFSFTQANIGNQLQKATQTSTDISHQLNKCTEHLTSHLQKKKNA